MNLNDRISRIIQYTGLTSSEFADEIDVQRSSVSHITSGRNKPSLDFLIKVKDRFPELNWDWLIIGEGNMTAEKNSSNEKSVKEEKELSSIPPHELFAVIDDEEFGKEEAPKNSANFNSREFPIPQERLNHAVLDDSQQLVPHKVSTQNNNIENQVVSTLLNTSSGKKLKKILLLFDDGSFETYES